ncbi:4'-phosphopantetheinyl transferase family protein [Chitinophaga japonensis]|uniref:4'-phosphopantetheinyl transferase n=1 Tax=Chitinophaga japonensis TaxID=104662 RepID=A0A562SLF3_CHIJA|nr:4'-phosphopantetheinyl transferase superfamily protein [Chitinophaga japonensis]TWI82115.1 4'-phosphopantetheinyl transferase [Chitinophaga japonensis]
MVYVYYCKNSPLPVGVYRSWLQRMPDPFVRRLNRLAHRHDAQASLLGRMLLLYALQNLGYRHLSLHDIRFTAYQRPYFEHTDLDFNISHSGNYVICAIAEHNKIGIDIEEVKPVCLDDFETLFSEAELLEIRRDPCLEQDAFYSLWTQKEALVKAEGSGLNFPVRDIVVQNGSAVLSGTTWHLCDLDLVEGYKTHLAMQMTGNNTVTINPLRMVDMLEA